MDATARAQAVDALEQAAQALKRTIGVNRRVLQVVRQVQVGLAEGEDKIRALGIEVQTQPKEGTVNGSEDNNS